MRFLFVKTHFAWPRSSGHDVHSYGMMKALADQGHEVAIMSREPVQREAIEGIAVVEQRLFGREAPSCAASLAWPQKRFCSFWGIPENHVVEVEDFRREIKADVVVAVGLEVLPYLANVKSAQRIWYAADEWVLHHFSQVSLGKRQSWSNIRDGIIKGLYEFAFASRVDRVWVVSNRDAWATRLVMMLPAIDVVPNGVDSKHFAPQTQTELPFSCVFWGRLDFGPNLDAIDWFVRRVWPLVKAKIPQAKFTVYGFQPGDLVYRMAKEHQFEIVPDAPDLRSAVCSHQVVVLPFVSGAGIKNKFLEAAALSRPILASNVALNGVQLFGQKPCQVARSPQEWSAQLQSLWTDSEKRSKLGTTARNWVTSHYTWDAAALTILKPLARHFGSSV